ncbi:MAG: tRNA (adenosine(37)-N6)-threonylcarbamoyltransferase complex dimerization subunit type 1 TsaB [Burkholderia sp.]|nr:tRNA (adenosine(37)-N6)-threonylcarbamoyltransferase complex dimerization subunit type 1 TsaB [Burkholderia sp.]
MARTILLAIETSTKYCSVALLYSSNFRDLDNTRYTRFPIVLDSEYWIRHELTGVMSSTRVLPAISELFNESGFKLSDCDAIAFGSGPGSFTGLRIATGVVQGLAFGLSKPVIPVSTLLACAEQARHRAPDISRVLTAIDARMNEVYWADYSWNHTVGNWHAIYPATLSPPDSLQVPNVPFTLAGNAAEIFGSTLLATKKAASIDHEALPHALSIAYLALRAYRAGYMLPADLAIPYYIRNNFV